MVVALLLVGHEPTVDDEAHLFKMRGFPRAMRVVHEEGTSGDVLLGRRCGVNHIDGTLDIPLVGVISIGLPSCGAKTPASVVFVCLSMWALVAGTSVGACSLLCSSQYVGLVGVYLQFESATVTAHIALW